MSDPLYEAIAKRFRLLSDPVRLKILNRLNTEPTSVGELAVLTGTSQPNVSKHLAVLKEGGIVRRRREGGAVHYEIADPSVFELCRLVCGGLEAQLDAQHRLLSQVDPYPQATTAATIVDGESSE